MSLADGVSFFAASPGTGAFVFHGARASFRTPAQAVTDGALADGGTYSYLAQDSLVTPTQREWGHAVFSGSTFTRTPLGGVSAGSDTGTNLVNFTVPPIVSLTVLAEDVPFGWQDIKQQWGAVGDGVTDDSQAFFNFQQFAIAQNPDPAILVIPPGNYVTQGAQNGALFWTGITNITIYAYGATLSTFGRGGVLPQAPYGMGSAKIQSTVIGNTSVTLINSALASQFAIGNWIVVSSIETQGSGGYPPNWYHFEFVQITNIVGGVISVSPALRYAHLSTYPDTSSPSYYTGGPASIFLLDQTWVQTVNVYGMTIEGISGIISAQTFHCTDMVFNAADTGPSVGDLITFTDSRFLSTAFLEIDKVVSKLKFAGCRMECNVANVSASIDAILYENCEILAGLNGTAAKSILIKNSHVGILSLGSGFGPGGNVQIEGSRIDDLNTSFSQLIPIGNVSFSNGTFSMLTSSPNIFELWAFVPGHQCFLTGSGDINPPNWAFPFVVTNIRTDATHTYLDTTLTAVPSYTIAGGGTATLTDIVGHPCARFSGRANFGSPDVINLSQTAGETPVYSYARALLTGNSDGSPVFGGFNAMGAITQITINVIRAYTGAQSTLNLDVIGSSGGFLLNQTTAVWTRTSPTVNLKIAGVRTITQAAVTGNQSGDSLAAWGASNWLPQGLFPTFDQDISGDTFAQWPLVDLQVTTDQGVNAISLQFVGTSQIAQ